eukprot:3087597-Pyramimonas_sp.AAC.1
MHWAFMRHWALVFAEKHVDHARLSECLTPVFPRALGLCFCGEARGPRTPPRVPQLRLPSAPACRSAPSWRSSA